MEKLRFSVIIPVYNVEQYLKDCLDSVVGQTFRDFEVIVIDDGSTDNSGKICDDYAGRDRRISVIHQENHGHLFSRQSGLKRSKGEYICFIDSDDTVCKDMLFEIDKIIADRCPDIIQFKFRKTDPDGNELYEEAAVFGQGDVSKEDYFHKVITTSFMNSLCIKICKRSLFDIDVDYGEYYRIKTGEDLLQSLPVIAAAEKFYYCDRAFYNYRTNPSSITHNYDDAQYKTLFTVRPKVYETMVKLGLDDEKNIAAFYRMYLRVLWAVLYGLYKNKGFEKAIFEEIFEYSHVSRAREYLSAAPFVKKTGLRLFYRRRWRSFCAYLKICRFLKR